MPLRIYKLRRIYSSPAAGSTRPAHCSVSAFLKFDDPESPHCVYNEYVSLRLAQTCNFPVADGGLTVCGDGHAFVSLHLGSPGLPLPNATPNWRERITEKYPDEVAAVVALDLWIGNWDRGEAIKATLVNPHLSLFAAYDHSHALLNIEADPWSSIERLRGDDLAVPYHPFYGSVRRTLLEQWLQRISLVPDATVRSACCFGHPFRGVTVEMQEALVEALCRRKANLGRIVGSSEKTVRSI